MNYETKCVTKYALGDEVVVRADLVNRKVYNMRGDPTGLFAVKDMLHLRGVPVKIVSVDTKYNQPYLCYKINEEPCGVRWTDEMFEGYVSDRDDINIEDYI